MKVIARLTLHVCLLAGACFAAAPVPEAANPGEEIARMADVSGHYGGHLTIGQRAEPKTLNPVPAAEAVSREVIGRLMADLIDINRSSQQTEPALAKSWKISPDGRTFTLQLRKGIRFSDGHPFDADDVVFSFNVYMDEAVDSPQRDLLIIDGKPILVTKLDQYTVRFALPRPYAAAERLFDGLAMLPKHLLEKQYHDGHFKQAWFSDLKFRQAISAAVDRESIVRLVYGTRGAALWGNVGPGNKLWINQTIPHPRQSAETARQLLKAAGYSWNAAGQLLDATRRPVEFSIITSSSNSQRMKMATLLQDDLSHLGMQVHVVQLEFRAMIDRVFQSFDYDAAIMGLGGGDADPNPEMNVWAFSGTSHLWHLGETKPATDWERELDQLMQQQMVTLDYAKRKQL